MDIIWMQTPPLFDDSSPEDVSSKSEEGNPVNQPPDSSSDEEISCAQIPREKRSHRVSTDKKGKKIKYDDAHSLIKVRWNFCASPWDSKKKLCALHVLRLLTLYFRMQSRDTKYIV